MAWEPKAVSYQNALLKESYQVSSFTLSSKIRYMSGESHRGGRRKRKSFCCSWLPYEYSVSVQVVAMHEHMQDEHAYEQILEGSINF